jgi:DNA-binding GntR family transcriptional regulator
VSIEVADTSALATSSETAAAIAYERIQRMIVTLELPPGTVLTESALGARIGLGRTPIREALHRLAGERLVTIFPRRGLVVAHLDFPDIQQLFETRILVEGANAKRAAQRGSASDDVEISRLSEAVQAAEGEGSFAAFLDADRMLHLGVARVARNTFTEEVTRRLLTLSAWLWHAHMARDGIEPSDYASHDQIVAAITHRDPLAAEQAMVDHIERSRHLLRIAL